MHIYIRTYFTIYIYGVSLQVCINVCRGVLCGATSRWIDFVDRLCGSLSDGSMRDPQHRERALDLDRMCVRAFARRLLHGMGEVQNMES